MDDAATRTPWPQPETIYLLKGRSETGRYAAGMIHSRSQVSALRSQVQVFSTWYRFRTRTRTRT